MRTLPPYLWVALQVHDGDDEDAVRPDLVEDSVRKPARDAATRTGGERRPSVWECPDRLESGLNLLGKLLAESRPLGVVPINRIREFPLGAGEDADLHGD